MYLLIPGADVFILVFTSVPLTRTHHTSIQAPLADAPVPVRKPVSA